MYKVLLDNTENDKLLEVNLIIIPRIGDWIRLDDNDEFTDGEVIMTVHRVILVPNSDEIKIVVKS